MSPGDAPAWRYTGTNEFDVAGAFNEANEQNERGTNTGFVYNDRGEMTDDGADYRYTYDAFGRLTEVRARVGNSLIAAYRYNGLGQRIGWHDDTDADGTVESTSDDPWTYGLYNERWQLVAELTGDGVSGADIPDDPTVCFVHHHAGLGGRGGSSYIDSVILADADTNADGTLNDRTYFVQNWRHDVVALLGSAGVRIAALDYTPYGEPIGGLVADIDQDGEVDFDDFVILTGQTTTDCGPGGCSADLDRDGDVDFDDFVFLTGESGTTHADTVGDFPDRAHGRGYAGYVRDDGVELYHVRNRAYRADLGRWTCRDPMGYVDGANVYGYVKQNAIAMMDALGLCASCLAGPWLPSDGWLDPFSDDYIDNPFVQDGDSGRSIVFTGPIVLPEPRTCSASEWIFVRCDRDLCPFSSFRNNPTSIPATHPCNGEQCLVTARYNSDSIWTCPIDGSTKRIDNDVQNCGIEERVEGGLLSQNGAGCECVVMGQYCAYTTPVPRQAQIPVGPQTFRMIRNILKALPRIIP